MAILKESTVLFQELRRNFANLFECPLWLDGAIELLAVRCGHDVRAVGGARNFVPRRFEKVVLGLQFTEEADINSGIVAVYSNPIPQRFSVTGDYRLHGRGQHRNQLRIFRVGVRIGEAPGSVDVICWSSQWRGKDARGTDGVTA